MNTAESSAQAAATIVADRLPKGFTSILDWWYILRPEEIEGVLIIYRITGRAEVLESAWDMFPATNATTAPGLASSAARGVTVETKEWLQAADLRLDRVVLDGRDGK